MNSVCVCDRRVVQQSLERHGETAFGPDLQNGSCCSSLVWRVYGLSHVVYMVLVHTLALPCLTILIGQVAVKQRAPASQWCHNDNYVSVFCVFVVILFCTAFVVPHLLLVPSPMGKLHRLPTRPQSDDFWSLNEGTLPQLKSVLTNLAGCVYCWKIFPPPCPQNRFVVLLLPT